MNDTAKPPVIYEHTTKSIRVSIFGDVGNYQTSVKVKAGSDYMELINTATKYPTLLEAIDGMSRSLCANHAITDEVRELGREALYGLAWEIIGILEPRICTTDTAARPRSLGEFARSPEIQERTPTMEEGLNAVLATFRHQHATSATRHAVVAAVASYLFRYSADELGYAMEWLVTVRGGHDMWIVDVIPMALRGFDVDLECDNATASASCDGYTYQSTTPLRALHGLAKRIIENGEDRG